MPYATGATIVHTGLPAAISVYLKKLLKEQGCGHDFTLTSYAVADHSDCSYNITCPVCRQREGRVLCDWSEGYGLDGLIDFVLEFAKKHEHVAKPSAGRKFREET